jgi:hypothetical protein
MNYIIVATCLLTVLLALHTEAATTPFVIATTFNSHNNNDSFVQINTSNSSYISTKLNAVASSYSAVGFDPKTRLAYFLGVADQAYFDIYNVDTLQVAGPTVFVPPPFAPIDIQFDASLNLLVGVDSDETSTGIYSYNIKTGDRTTIVANFPDIEGIDESQTSVYDQYNHRYYVSAITSNASAPFQYFVANVATKKLERTIAVKDFIQNAQYDPVSNSIVGIYENTMSFASFDLVTEKLLVYPHLGLSKFGFRELQASAIDVKSGIYHVLFENHQAQTTMIQVDFRNLTFKTFAFYDHIGVMQFVPAQ